MKYYVLLLIFAIAYQGVTGFSPRNQVYQYVSNHLKEQPRKRIYPIVIESIDRKTENPLFIPPIPSIPSSGFFASHVTVPYMKELIEIEDKNNNAIEQQRLFVEKHTELYIEKAIEAVETVVGMVQKVYEEAKNFLYGIKNKKKPSESENKPSGNQTEASIPQTTPSFDESLINQPTTPVKINNNKKKPQNIKDSVTPESTTSNIETQENVSPTVSTLDESTVNQQTTPAKIDNNKKKPEDIKDSVTSESTTSSTETQENVSPTASTLDESTVNQQSTPDKNNDNKKQSEDIKDSVTPESTTSSNETQLRVLRQAMRRKKIL
ncbi:uncharacterized protein LOC105196403 [Solenopsis invicta]|uniref:uncharacterized protein LOC105196403 n=1 Tax=Solenopsis invicta TaxID=13686 RepID=UPI00193D212C|nr:uncharacterized protein LOC105196403 [Solenopsis invicta]